MMEEEELIMKRQNTTAVFRGLLAGICLIGISVTGCQTKTEVTQQTQKKTEEHETEKQTEKQSSAYTFTDDLERTALQQVDQEVAFFSIVYGKFNIDRIMVGILYGCQDPAHHFCKCLLFQNSLAGGKAYRSVAPHLPQPVFGIGVVFQQKFL